MGWWNQYVGIPYLTHGRDRAGCDCWGLLRLVYTEQFGIQLPSYGEEYADASDRVGVSAPLAHHLHFWDRVEKPAAGDGVLFCISGIPCHIGVVTERGFMLHVTRGINTVVEPYLMSRWRSRVEGTYRYIRQPGAS